MVIHPIPKGTRILSVSGEWDGDDDGEDRYTGPNAIGTVVRVDHYASQGWTYGVWFDNGTSVYLDEGDLRDEAAYQVGV